MDAIQKQLDEIEADLNAIERFVKDKISGSFLGALPGVGGIVAWIQQQLDRAENEVNSVADNVKDQIADLSQGAIPSAIDSIEGLIGNLTSTVQRVVSNLATADDFAVSVINVLRKHAPTFEPWLINVLISGVGNATLGTLKTLESEHPEAIDPMLDELLKLPHMPAWFHAAASGARHRHAPWFAFIIPALALAALLPVLGALGEPIVQATRQGAFDKLPTRELPPEAAVEAMTKRLMQYESYHHRMRQHGFNEDVADLMFQARRERMPLELAIAAFRRGLIDDTRYEEELEERGFVGDRPLIAMAASNTLLPEPWTMAAYLRGEISATQHDSILRQMGWPKANAELVRRLYFRIPDPADLIHMAIRNVFQPEIVERSQLDQSFPEPFRHAAALQGISEDWAHKYWQAHWEIPSMGQGFEMFQRTIDEGIDPHADTITLSDGSRVQNVIGLSTLRILQQERDIAPFYRDKLQAISYNPLTRIDVRRMHKVGVLTHAQVQRAYLDLGYSPENALRLADYVVKLNEGEAKDRSLSITDALRQQIIRLYVAAKIDYSDAAFAFTDLGFSPEEADLYISLANIQQSADDAQAIESGLGRLYIAGNLTREEVRKRLTDAGVPDAGIVRLFSKWDLAIQYDTEKRLTPATKDLSKSEVLDAFKAGMVLEEDATTYLDHLGYSEDEIGVLIGLANYQRSRDTRKAQQDAIKSLYVNGVRERLDISNALDQMGMLAGQRDSLLLEWDLLREQRTEKLPLATLRDMWKAGIVDTDSARIQLRRHRLSEEDAALLIALWQKQSGQGGI